MGQPGIGAMLHYLGGGSENDAAKYIGKAITGAIIKDDRLNIDFEDGTKISIWDNGQSCCESRYMTTDDDVAVLVGGKLVNIEAKPGADMKESEYGDDAFLLELIRSEIVILCDDARLSNTPVLVGVVVLVIIFVVLDKRYVRILRFEN